jgi:hypothetical protein
MLPSLLPTDMLIPSTTDTDNSARRIGKATANFEIIIEVHHHFLKLIRMLD